MTGDETATFVAPLAGDSVATNEFVEVLRSYWNNRYHIRHPSVADFPGCHELERKIR